MVLGISPEHTKESTALISANAMLRQPLTSAEAGSGSGTFGPSSAMISSYAGISDEEQTAQGVLRVPRRRLNAYFHNGSNNLEQRCSGG